LAAEWTELRSICSKYRFGRVELMPIKKTGEAVARYVAGYLSKSWERVPVGRKSRLVRLSRTLSRNISMRFSPNTLGDLIYRTRLKLAASMLPFDGYDVPEGETWRDALRFYVCMTRARDQVYWQNCKHRGLRRTSHGVSRM
jgi:hypothetical protein